MSHIQKEGAAQQETATLRTARRWRIPRMRHRKRQVLCTHGHRAQRRYVQWVCSCRSFEKGA